MDIEQSICYELGTITGFANKVFPNASKQGTVTPYCVYVLTNTTREQELTGHNGLVEARFDIYILENGYSKLKSSMALFINKLKTLNNSNIGIDGVFLQQLDIENEYETYQPNVDLYQGTIEIVAYYQE